MKQKKRKKGRPSKLEQIDLKQVEALAGLGLKDTEIANVLGVSEKTLNTYKKNPYFLQSLKTGKDKADANVARALYNNAINGNVTAQIFWLKNRRKEDWREKYDIDHSGSIEQKIAKMTPEEREERIKELKKLLFEDEEGYVD